jgi:hypothetical protein
LGVAPSTSITGPSSAGGSSQDQLAQAINYVAEAATFVEGLDKEAVARKSKKGVGRGQSGGASTKGKKKEKEREVVGDHEMGPADEGEVEGGKPSKGKEKKAKGKEQEMGQEKPEVKAPPKGRKPAKENIKWVSVTGDARCGRCVSMNLCCLRPAHGSTSNGIAVTACKVCKEKKSKCMWGVEGETDNNIAAAAADDDDEEVALSPLADKASGSRRGTVKGLNPTGRPRTRSQSRAREESPEPLEVDDTDFQLGLQQQLVSLIKHIFWTLREPFLSPQATQKTQPIVKPPNRQPETKRQVPVCLDFVL